MKTEQQNRMKNNKNTNSTINHNNVWFFVVDIKPINDISLLLLVDYENDSDFSSDLDRAIANIIVQANDLKKAKTILVKGLIEKQFEINEICYIYNVGELIKKQDIEEKFIDEASWLLSSEYVFKIIDPIYPYDSSLG